MMMGLGKEKIRELPTEYSGNLPPHCRKLKAYLPGTLIIESTDYESMPDLATEIAQNEALQQWPCILLVDSLDGATCSTQEFLWTFFTRFEPAADIHGASTNVQRFHVGLTPPIVFDCRMKPWYTDILEVDDATRKLVDSRIAKLLPRSLR
jgi:hypothetical protein